MKEGATPVAHLESVTHRYGAVLVLDGVTLDIPTGAMVGVIGPDGVGKSTLLGIIAGARRIQSGEVFSLGGDMASNILVDLIYTVLDPRIRLE